jgi:spermidine/putrescine transport system ATP-binding protein
LSHGRIEQIGAPSEIYERPATTFVAEFIGSSNLFPGRIVGQNGTDALVETETGLRLCCSAHEAGGTEVSVLLRPERIRVQPPDTGAATNCFAARVVEVTYLGEDLHLGLKLARGLVLRAALKNAGAARGWATAQAVEIVVDPADLRLLPR